MVQQNNSDSQHRSQLSISSSPSKDNGHNKNRHVSSSIACRKALILIAFVAAIIVILLQKPPNVVTSESSYMENHRDSRIVTAEENMDEHRESRTVKIETMNPIRLIAILGERNSGTRWTFE